MNHQFEHIDSSVFNDIINEIENSNESFLITGKAGTGKSTLLKELIKNTKKKAIVIAPTGLAAIQVGGQTIHSTFLFPLRPLIENDTDIIKFSKNNPRSKLLKQAELIIIDEISMVRADILDGINQSLQLNSENADLPFGGKQLIMIGDPFQLEPVITNTPLENYLYQELYESPYFFSSKIFKATHINCIELQKVYRQKDKTFIHLLDQIRKNQLEYEELEYLNNQFNPKYSYKLNQDFIISLCSINKRALEINEFQLNRLESKTYIYQAKISGEINLNHIPVSYELKLKKGAQIIFTKNNIEGKWVNGTLGKVIDCFEDYITVELDSGMKMDVYYETWENIEYEWNPKAKNIVKNIKGTFSQLPCKLAWAMTIHKSQGLTFDRVIIDLNGGTFAHGQLYVALSRCRSLDGIVLTKRLKFQDIIVDERIVDFVSGYRM